VNRREIAKDVLALKVARGGHLPTTKSIFLNQKLRGGGYWHGLSDLDAKYKVSSDCIRYYPLKALQSPSRVLSYLLRESNVTE